LQLFEPDYFQRRRGHRVNLLEHILHVLGLQEILQLLYFRRLQLGDDVNSVAILAAAGDPPVGGGVDLNTLNHSSKFSDDARCRITAEGFLRLVVVIAAVVATPVSAASGTASDTCVRHGRQGSANSGLRGTDAEHHSILSGTEQHHQTS
jgi:hypothetical protein